MSKPATEKPSPRTVKIALLGVAGLLALLFLGAIILGQLKRGEKPADDGWSEEDYKPEDMFDFQAPPETENLAFLPRSVPSDRPFDPSVNGSLFPKEESTADRLAQNERDIDRPGLPVNPAPSDKIIDRAKQTAPKPSPPADNETSPTSKPQSTPTDPTGTADLPQKIANEQPGLPVTEAPKTEPKQTATEPSSPDTPPAPERKSSEIAEASNKQQTDSTETAPPAPPSKTPTEPEPERPPRPNTETTSASEDAPPPAVRPRHPVTPQMVILSGKSTKLLRRSRYYVSVDQLNHFLKEHEESPRILPNGSNIALASWTEAMAFTAWLTEQHRNTGQISDTVHYRLPRKTESPAKDIWKFEDRDTGASTRKRFGLVLAKGAKPSP